MEKYSDATLWFRKNGCVYEFNHIEDGHAVDVKPAQKHASQSGWAKGCWIREHVRLDGNVPAQVVHDECAKAARIEATAAARK